MKHSMFFLPLMIIIITCTGLSTKIFGQGNIPDDFCITDQEYRLFQKINEYRISNGLAIIPFSKSLSYVAKIHVRDLFKNKPDTSYCNLNSWSDQGAWTACCHSSMTPQADCILGKPRELTGYDGEGHELCYWENVPAHPDTVLNFWKTVEQANDIFLNKARWERYNWQAIGIGIYKGYASVWVGEQQDTLQEPGICPAGDLGLELLIPLPAAVAPSEAGSMVVTEPDGRFYLIFGSFTVLDDATGEMKRLKDNGFEGAKVLVKDENYRVSLADFSSIEDAKSAKNRLPDKYREAWILRY